MLSTIKTLFNERAFLISKQMTLARTYNIIIPHNKYQKELETIESINHLQERLQKRKQLLVNYLR